MYDYLIVGAGIYGATVANLLHKAGYKVLVIDKRKHIGGNCYTERIENIDVHRYGAHIFHTNDDAVWEYLGGFTRFNNYVHTVKASYKGAIYSLPFNMNTFHEMWGVSEPEEAQRIIDEQKRNFGIVNPENLEEQAISMVGYDIYEKLVKHYTEKQWGRSCSELPSFIIKRLPLRMEYDNSYFNAKYQGIPEHGYTEMIEKMLCGIEVRLDTDYLKHRDEYDSLARETIYTGQVDALFDYCYGNLEYRSLRFETELLETESFQDTAVVNYTDDSPFTRIIEHKWFNMPKESSGKTVITSEYAKSWTAGDEPFYPINDSRNNELYQRYRRLAEENSRLHVGGRLGDYRYYDMDAAVAAAFDMVKSLIGIEK